MAGAEKSCLAGGLGRHARAAAGGTERGAGAEQHRKEQWTHLMIAARTSGGHGAVAWMDEEEVARMEKGTARDSEMVGAALFLSGGVEGPCSTFALLGLSGTRR